MAVFIEAAKVGELQEGVMRTVAVAGREVLLVKVGDSFRYKVDGDQTVYTGTIYKIYPTIDSKSRKMLAEVKAENFPVGLFGDGYITAK